MNNKGKLDVRKDLKSQRAATLKQIAALDDFRENYPGADFEIHLALRQELYKKIEQIDEALERWQDGQYGLCEMCGLPIDPNRLAIRPQATTCVECQLKRETRRGGALLTRLAVTNN
jgi:RNA polymerase-binding protein DksA